MTNSTPPTSSFSPAKRNNFRKCVSSRSFQQQTASPSFSSNKTMLDSLNASSCLSSDSVPLLTPEQPMPSQPSALQPFLCNNVLSQPPESPTIVSLLQGNIQTDVNNLPPTQESLPSPINVITARQQLKQSRTNRFFPQQTFDEPQFIQQPVASVQVPLAQKHAAPSAVPISNTKEAKNAKHPLFFSLSLGQINQTASPGSSFKISTTGSILQPPTVTNAETPFRRHSYTTGQHLQPAPSILGDYMGSKRSRPIVPAAANGTFVVPEIPVSTIPVLKLIMEQYEQMLHFLNYKYNVL